MVSFIQDLRYALRTLSRTSGFAAIAVLVIALGIGANTAIFTFTNAYLLKPLPFPDSGRLVMIRGRALFWRSSASGWDLASRSESRG